ncbi:MAG: hypothetical protein MZV65_45215 [Chromatiales bacterium]|nr:hypothetical protein [Chromatiales bacterium]
MPNCGKRFIGKSRISDQLISGFVAREVREIMAEMGFRKFDDMVGRTDLLEQSNRH